ncbi:antiviral reverse transcriptase Drt3b [Sphingomonas sp. Leaf257]|uniref:antiviral reverse transcriptase Drt3b n=1 Tax=Sphingomonas sp. Leaf257 TaxID=1736309 RepID=UPI0009EBA35A|nr:antiviral reverse transcriptase Drt3b [Sphingomonas sp. Leaf257]
MSRKGKRLSNRVQRPILSDTLPFEVPASFSNRHLCKLLIKYDVRLDSGVIRWTSPDDSLDIFIRMLTGVAETERISISSHNEFGKQKQIRSLRMETHMVTIPFQFEICHKEKESRRLTVPHPLNQLAVAEFYNEHSSIITYYANRSPYSIRKPTAVARYSNFKDRMHDRLLAAQNGQVEERNKEYDQLGSYFCYETYSNIFKFFESFQYHRAEKRYDAMAKSDISKCFDSIYTHSLAWAIHGNQAVKDGITTSNSTFSGRFDALMRSLNQNETNGIVIGPEFSRIFAELILQSVDQKLEIVLRKKNIYHRVDYEIYRYVDDYYIFYNKSADLDIIVEQLRHLLVDVKLAINPDKTKIYNKPIITEITVAKNSISDLFNSSIVVTPGSQNRNFDATVRSDDGPAIENFTCRVDSKSLITAYKTILKISNVTYIEVGNYTFALIEKKIDKILTAYVASSADNRSELALTRALIEMIEFAFFVYASAPRVNISIRVARIVSIITKSMRNIPVSIEHRHRFFKYVHENAVHQLKKNQVLDFKEIENLYLLVALGEIGKEYCLDENSLLSHLKIKKSEDGIYKSEYRIGYFTITVLLLYLKNKVRYNGLRNFLIEEAVSHIEARKHYRHRDAEVFMMSLDIISCPFVDDIAKKRIAAVYGLSDDQFGSLTSLTTYWFTTWSGGKIADELDAKRRREVY